MPEFVVTALPKKGLTQQVSATNPAEAIEAAKANPNNWTIPSQHEREWEYEVSQPDSKVENVFSASKTISQLIGNLVGAASVCWENLEAAGEFKSDQANTLVDQALERLQELVIQ